MSRINYTQGEIHALLGPLVDLDPQELGGYIIIALSSGKPPTLNTDTNDPMQIIKAMAYCIQAVSQRVTGAGLMEDEHD